MKGSDIVAGGRMIFTEQLIYRSDPLQAFSILRIRDPIEDCF